MHRVFLPALIFAVAACGGVQRPEPQIMQQGGERAMRGRVTDHVIVISVDGLRPDAIAKFGARTFSGLMARGRYSLTAQTIAISRTLPSHTSMLTGVDSDQHKITWNSDRTGEFGHVQVPTVFGLARAAGFETAAFYSKSKFHHIDAPGSIDHTFGPKQGLLPWNAGRVSDLVVKHLERNRPSLMFVHLSDADFAGHTFGWMGRMYGLGVLETDAAVARILEAADRAFGPGHYTVLLTSDHGGHGKSHGAARPENTTIPWIVAGAGVQRGDTLTGIRTMDTAATVLWMLNIAAPENLVGRPVADAFTTSTARR